jgi:hypothetical protein
MRSHKEYSWFYRNSIKPIMLPLLPQHELRKETEIWIGNLSSCLNQFQCLFVVHFFIVDQISNDEGGTSRNPLNTMNVYSPSLFSHTVHDTNSVIEDCFNEFNWRIFQLVSSVLETLRMIIWTISSRTIDYMCDSFV